ncbi:MAG TPA: hypothetical protein VD833_15490 [Vicinamibacterales bacterium]|nr:hypothetical protein [Vicinamibacterales bacterium]
MRMAVRARALVLGAAVVVPGAAWAQTVDDIVARHVAARGGAEKLEAIRTLKITRTVATAFSDIKVVIYRKRPALFRAEQQSTAPGAPLTVRVINQDGAWDPGPGGKIVAREDRLAAETRDLDADFDGLLVNWSAKGHTVTFEGREQVGGREALKLQVRLRSGLIRTVYLDAETYLDRRHSGVLNLPGGRQFDVTIDFDNWREVEGVKFPFDVTEERTGKEPVQSFVIYTERIEANVPIDDGLFAAPKG